MTALTSVVMVSYYTGPILFEAIERILNQGVPTELILLDNGNPPDVIEKLKSLASTQPRP